MSKTQVTFADGAPDWCKKIFFDRFKGTGMELEEAEDSPYLIANPYTMLHPGSMHAFLKKLGSRIAILDCAGEAMLTDLNIFDYSIGFFKCPFGDRLVYFPAGMENYLDIVDKCNKISPEEKAAKHEHFCNFIYSNPKAHPCREQLFKAIEKYKPVHAPGRVCNNMPGDGLNCTDANDDWYSASIKFKSNYKFSIAAENAFLHNYTSEKIATTFLAGSVPIYWGNPLIFEDYNSEAFINVFEYNTLYDVIEAVKKIDTDDKLYMKMLSSPCKTDEQVEVYMRAYHTGREMLCDIFTHTSKRIRYRRGFGPLLDSYRAIMDVCYTSAIK